MPRVIVSFPCLWEGYQPPENMMKMRACKSAEEPGCRSTPRISHCAFYPFPLWLSFWLFRLIAYLEVSPAFGVTVKTAPCISRYSHRESHHVHQARCLRLKPQENSHSASPRIKVYRMPVFCTRLWNEQVFPCTFSIYTQTSGSLCRL